MRFSRLNNSALKIFTTDVINGMTGNPAFPSPLIPLAELTSLQSVFGDAIVAAEMGGRLTTVQKNQARADLMSALRRQASYVQGIAKHDEEQLISSGFTAMSRNTAQHKLATPILLKILNERTQSLTLRITPITNARNYQVQVRSGQGGWQEAGIFPQARRMEVTGLTPGTIYEIRVRALGGSTGYSEWSAVTSRMSL